MPYPLNRNRFFLFFVAAAVLMCLCGASCLFAGDGKSSSGSAQLVVQTADGKTVLTRDFPRGSSFGIRFIHSVAKTPVIDWFSAPDGTLQLDKTVYQDFGAGLPHRPEAGQTMRVSDGHIVISGYDMPLPSFDVRVGRVAHHTLLLPEAWEEIPLDTLASPGAALTFTVQTAQ